MAGEENLRQDAHEVLLVGAPSVAFPKLNGDRCDGCTGVATFCMAFLLDVFCLNDFVVLTRHVLRSCWCDRLCLECCIQMMKGCAFFAAASSKSYLSFLPTFVQDSLRFVSYYGSALRFGAAGRCEEWRWHARLPKNSIHA